MPSHNVGMLESSVASLVGNPSRQTIGQPESVVAPFRVLGQNAIKVMKHHTRRQPLEIRSGAPSPNLVTPNVRQLEPAGFEAKAS